MAENPAPTPQELRDKAAQATRLADSTMDAQAKANLLAYAQELLAQAAQLDATTTGTASAGAVGHATTAAVSPRSDSASVTQDGNSQTDGHSKD